MIRFINTTLLRIIKKLFSDYSLETYSQEGEDIILRRIFEQKAYGFYVDIGANHPKRFSTTNYFYIHGRRGINIDATPGSMIAFRKMRPKDINVEIPISDESKALTFYIFTK